MFFERPASGEKSILVHITIASECERNDPSEFEELAISAGALPAAWIKGTRQKPSPGHFVGAGKLAELATAVAAHDAELVLFNHALSPRQERNLEKSLKCRVLDRTGLILDIFAQRARSHEGKLQVELARLRHLSTRLVRGWTHLDRQKGGINLRGVGETQLELDQRMIGQRIKAIDKGLARVRRQRQQGRRSRRRAEAATVSLVGYTNAGKSSLFNRLGHAETRTANQLFATLDPTLRRINLPNYGPAILADTVGFISHLPHELVAAFRSTLEESSMADLLLHVIDAANESCAACVEQVNGVLVEIGAVQAPRLKVFNKIDLLANCQPRIERDGDGVARSVWLSAKTGAGIDLLREAVSELLAGGLVEATLRIDPRHGRLRSELYDNGFIEDEHIDETGCWRLRVRLPRQRLDRILRCGATRIRAPQAVALAPRSPG